MEDDSVDGAAPPPAAVAVNASWTANLRFRPPSGFWGDAEWYDLQLERRLPLVRPMLAELVYALPPLGAGRVCDLCGGSGRASVAMRSAYPRATLVVVDGDADRLASAAARVAPPVETITAAVAPDAPTLPGAPYDAVVACLAVRHLVSPAPHYARHAAALKPPADESDVVEGYEALLASVYCSLRAGGTFLVGDHVERGHPGVFAHCKLFEAAGFVDVDVAWRKEDYFVVGGRIPADDPEPSWHAGMKTAGEVARREPSEDGIEMRAAATEDADDDATVDEAPPAPPVEMRCLSSDDSLDK